MLKTERRRRARVVLPEEEGPERPTMRFLLAGWAEVIFLEIPFALQSRCDVFGNFITRRERSGAERNETSRLLMLDQWCVGDELLSCSNELKSMIDLEVFELCSERIHMPNGSILTTPMLIRHQIPSNSIFYILSTSTKPFQKSFAGFPERQDELQSPFGVDTCIT